MTTITPDLVRTYTDSDALGLPSWCGARPSLPPN